MSNRLAILIGNGRFEQDPDLQELFGPRHDVASLGRLLSDPEVGNYIVMELLERDSRQLLDELEPLFAMVEPDSNVLLYYAGWVVSEPGRGLYLAAADTRLEDTADTAVPLSVIKGWLRRCGAAEMTVVLDCCYVAPGGGIDEAGVEHQLRRIRGDVSPDLHVIAAAAATRSPAQRETPTATGLEGAITRSIVEGLATGAADRDGDNVTSVRDLNEYLGIRCGDRRPLWAGPVEGVDPQIVANPHPLDGVDVGAFDAVVETRNSVRKVLLAGAAVLLLLAAGTAAYLLVPRRETLRVTHLEEYFAGPGMPQSVGLVDDLQLLRTVIDRTGWIEHTEPLDGNAPRYPGAVSFRGDPGSGALPATVDLGVLQSAEIEFGDGVHGFGVVCGAGPGGAQVEVEMVDGSRYQFEARTGVAGQDFFGLVARPALRRVRITAASTRFTGEWLYVYAEREYPRTGPGLR